MDRRYIYLSDKLFVVSNLFYKCCVLLLKYDRKMREIS